VALIWFHPWCMQRIAFIWEPAAVKEARESGELRVLVDDRDLVELVGEVELPYASAEGHPRIAGAYAGVHPRQLSGSISEHFRGGSGSDLACGPSDKTVLLACECGEAGCWPLMARIELAPGEVVWSDFEQPHRSGKWSYEDFGPLVFERGQYEAALTDVEAAMRPNAK